MDVGERVASLCAAARAGEHSRPWRNRDEVTLASGSQIHVRGVSQIAVDSKRRRLVLAGSNDGGLSLLDARDLSQAPKAIVRASNQRSGAGHSGRVQAVSWLSNDSRLFISAGDSTLKVWDVTALQESAASVALRAPVTAAALGSTAQAATALGDGTVRLVDMRRAIAVNTLQGHTRPPLCVTWGKPGTHQLFSGGMDGTVRAWDARMGARSLFLCDPYALDEDRPALKKSLSAEEMKRADRERGAERTISVKAKFEPYRVRSMKSMLGTGTGNSSQGFTSGGLDSEVTPLTDLPETEEERKERQTREKWKMEASKQARHWLEPPRREYEHEPSVAHRGAVIAVIFPTVDTAALPSCLFSCGIDGKVRCWDAATGCPSGQKQVFHVECWTKEIGLGVDAHGAPSDVLFVPEAEHVAAYCTRTGEQLCRLAAHTADVNCVAAVPKLA
mmetsp:Transcript_94388/g.243761  ORF Transcript_94388/g.243761 Transcript_94388/m.243761 type:complete len:446 (+) Transcript_94388:44-1381(+)